MYKIMSCMALVAALFALSCGGEVPPDDEVIQAESYQLNFNEMRRIWPRGCNEDCQLSLRLPEDFHTVTPIVPLSGNVQTKRFHKPGCPDYLCLACTTSFKTVREALAAGYRPHDCFE